PASAPVASRPEPQAAHSLRRHRQNHGVPHRRGDDRGLYRGPTGPKTRCRRPGAYLRPHGAFEGLPHP
ncbi:hypothetical protein ABTI56_19140, partial [Acinetobacter baumannii]